MKIGATDFNPKEINWTPSAIWLVIMNLIPIGGVFLFGWDVGTLLFLYWVESVIIGLLNIPKILSCRGYDNSVGRAAGKGGLTYLAIFFTVHYGMFSVGHIVFLSSFFDSIPSILDVFNGTRSGAGILLTMCGLGLSHVMSMLLNFYGKKEYLNRSAHTQMFMPYGRIVVMHVVIIVGGMLVQAFGQPILALLLLVGLKIIIDLVAHSVEHKVSKAGIS